MNSRAVVLVSALAAAAATAACPGDRTAPATYHTSAPPSLHGGADTGDRVAGGRFSRAEVQRAIQAEQDHLLTLDRRIQDAEAATSSSAAAAAITWSRLRADRTAAASFVAQLMACLDQPAMCPPSLDEPLIPRDFDPGTGEMTGAFTADPAAWPETAARLEKDACGCRTRACVDWVLADLARWEAAVPAAAQDDDAAAAHVVGARTCLWDRLGEHVRRPLAAGAED